MTPARVLATLVALAALAAVVWLLGSFAGDDPAPTAPALTPAPVAGVAPPAVAAGDVGREGSASDDATSRVVADSGSMVGGGMAIVGRIVAAVDNQPIAGATVRCTAASSIGRDRVEEFLAVLEQADAATRERQLAQWNEGVVTVQTDADGRFRIVPAKPKVTSFAIAVTARGHVDLRQSAGAPVGADVDLGTLAMKAGGTVRGRVVDSQGTPVRALVAWDSNEANELFGGAIEPSEALAQAMGGKAGVVCDAEGRFELAGLAPGDYGLRARHPDHPAARTPVLSIRAGATIDNVLIQLAPGATIRGVVKGLPAGVSKVRVRARLVQVRSREEMAGSPGPGSTIHFGAGSVSLGGPRGTDSGVRIGTDGSFALRGLQMGTTYTIYGVQQEKGFVESGDCTERRDVLAGSSGIELHYDLGIAVTFTVVDDTTAAPIERLVVRNDYESGDDGGTQWGATGSRSAKDYPAGKVTIANLRPKQQQLLRVRVAAVGYRDWSKASIALPTRGTLDLGVVRLSSVPRLEITVVDGKTSAPVAGAHVVLRRVGDDAAQAPSAGLHQGLTDAEGRCAVNAITDGEVRLFVHSDAHAPHTGEPMRLAADASTQQTVRMSSGGTVEVAVFDDRGPKPRATVLRRSLAGEHDTAITGDAGVARFRHLPAGEYGFQLQRHRGPFFEGAGITFHTVDPTAPPKAAFDASFTRVVVADGVTTRIELDAGPAVGIRGVVRQNGIALAGALIRFARGNGKPTGSQVESMQIAFEALVEGNEPSMENGGLARSGADGSYQIDDLEAGEHRLRISHKDRAMVAIVPVTLGAGDNIVDLDLDLAVVRGVVVDDQGRPVGKARVSVRRAAAKTAAGMPDATALAGIPGRRRDDGIVTAADGTFEARGVAADCELEVTAHGKGLAPASVTVTVARGCTADGVKIALGAAGRIDVTFAVPVRLARVTARWLGDGAVRPVTQNCNGASCTLDGLQPGRWEVTVLRAPDPREGDPPRRVVEVVAGTTAPAAF